MTQVVAFGLGAVAGFIVTAIACKKDSYNDNFSCANCKHIENEFDFDEPCCRCRRAYDDEWEVREDG